MNLTNLTDDELRKLSRELEDEIARYKVLQSVVKVSLNSIYGVTATPFFMYYDRRCAEAITLTGQLAIKWISSRLNEFFNRLLSTKGMDYVKLIDTDSVTLWCEPVLKWGLGEQFTLDQGRDFLSKFFDEMVVPYVDRQYEHLRLLLNAPESFLAMKVDSISSRSIYLSKKHYIYYVLEAEGVKFAEPELKLMGIEAVKSSTPKIVREAMKECITLMLTAQKKDVQNYIDNFRKRFMKEPVENVAYPRGVGNFSKYISGGFSGYDKGTTKHFRAAINFNNHLKINKLDNIYPLIVNGDKIKFMPLRMPNPIKDDVIGFKDRMPDEMEQIYHLSNYYDYEEQFEMCFMSPIREIMREAGMPINQNNIPSLFD